MKHTKKHMSKPENRLDRKLRYGKSVRGAYELNGNSISMTVDREHTPRVYGNGNTNGDHKRKQLINMHNLFYQDSYYRKRRMRRRIRLIVIIAFVATGIIVFLAKSDFSVEEATDPGTIHPPGGDMSEISVSEDLPPPRESEPIPRQEAAFSDCYFYEADKEERYVAFQEKNLDLSPDEIVWRVNSFLDYDFFEVKIKTDSPDLTIMVNKYYYVPDDFRPTGMISGSSGHTMRREVDEAFRLMQSDIAREINGVISVASAFRTVSYQESLFNSYLANDSRENVERYSARPGHSEHHTGLVIDVIGSFGSLRDFINTKEGPWVHEHAHKYGFIIRYKEGFEHITGYESEPWHLRYIGVDLATKMKKTGIDTFEEFKVKYIDHSP